MRTAPQFGREKNIKEKSYQVKITFFSNYIESHSSVIFRDIQALSAYQKYSPYTFLWEFKSIYLLYKQADVAYKYCNIMYLNFEFLILLGESKTHINKRAKTLLLYFFSYNNIDLLEHMKVMLTSNIISFCANFISVLVHFVG